MAISGSLKDVSVADVMQFIHLGRRTGTLLLTRGAQRAMIGFHGGRLVSAQAPRTPKLGDLLITSGLIDRQTLDNAIQAQSVELERRSLGQILITSGAIAAEGLRRVIAQQIEQAVAEVMVWDTGTFEFAIDDLRPIDDIALYPSDVLPDTDINTQMVLLEAARIFDERNRSRGETSSEAALQIPGKLRGVLPQAGLSAGMVAPEGGKSYLESAPMQEARDGRQPGVAVAEPAVAADQVSAATAAAIMVLEPGDEVARRRWETPKHAAERLRLQIVSRDAVLGEQLGEALRHEVAGIEGVSIAQAGLAAPGEPPPIVVVDLRRVGGVSLEEAAALRRARPRASVIALVDPETPVAKVYAVGMSNALPPDVEAIAACVENLIESREDLVRGSSAAEPTSPHAQSGVARLRRVFGDLRSGLISATVALNLMHIISESVERAVLFLVKRDHLVALGAFGTDAHGRPLAELTRGIKLSSKSETVFGRSLSQREVQSVSFEDAALPDPFRSLVGRSRNGQVVVFPVLGAQRVISVIYTDNGDRDEPIEDIDILELATAQVGMAFENELLRRQISQNRDE
jgi:DNA-binding NarL/FixJ family response regulator